ncbi:unnamed protein product [Brassicogethes aeneus]|uniref:Immediate early response gene 5-like protein n=1 Tax=Brassicogethes aeneus TaxID=1431903 RepID=A0A9P0FKI0_BRAAE|nr:unnamed protein product [Brassicogethes aeneus]
MASEAQRLIGISLTKIAQSRSHRGGVSLHKNLLVATVLQKARYIFMEEAYNMVHCQPPAPIQARPVPEDDLVGLTVEEAGLETSTGLPDDLQESSSSSDNLQEFLQPACLKCSGNQDKENHPPSYHSSSELTYLDLDKSSNVLRERCNSPSLKRRRAVAEWETEEAVQSILPKRSKQEEESEASDDSVFLDDAALLSDVVSKEVDAATAAAAEQAAAAAATESTDKCQQQQQQESSNVSGGSGSAMEIDRITSLVSIFSFSMGDSKLNRSVSTPDLCSAQAKDAPDSIQQRPFLAMTV